MLNQFKSARDPFFSSPLRMDARSRERSSHYMQLVLRKIMILVPHKTISVLSRESSTGTQVVILQATLYFTRGRYSYKQVSSRLAFAASTSCVSTQNILKSKTNTPVSSYPIQPRSRTHTPHRRMYSCDHRVRPISSSLQLPSSSSGDRFHQ